MGFQSPPYVAPRKRPIPMSWKDLQIWLDNLPTTEGITLPRDAEERTRVPSQQVKKISNKENHLHPGSGGENY